MHPGWRSLQAQTFAVVALLVIGLGGSGFVLLFDLFARYSATMTEALNRPLAAHVAEELRAVMREGGDAKASVTRLFARFMDVNPSVELYLLSEAGDILAFSAPPGEVKRERVDLAPVKALVANQFVYPIFADDPKDPMRRKAFSAAPLDPETPGSGYVFIILGGAEYDLAGRRIQGGLLARGALILAGVGVFAGVSAMLLARRRIIARLRRLSAEMAEFEAKGYRKGALNLIPPEAKGDEIDAVLRVFREMAAHMDMLLERVEGNDRARRDLIINAAHDLRTPIASARAHLETLAMKGLQFDESRRARHLETAIGELDRLSRFADEWLELGRLEAPNDAGERELLSLAEIVQDVVNKREPGARTRGVRLTADTGEGMPFVRADVALIERALDNLIDNALQYTPPGGRIALSIRRRDGLAAVDVADTGGGIKPEHLDRVFDRFYRAPGGPKPEGAGLGLAIVRRIAQLHGGEARVRSAPGEGATFTLELPAER